MTKRAVVLAVLMMIAAGCLKAQEFRLKKNSGRLELNIGRVTVEGHDGSEIIFTSENDHKEKDKRAEGLRPVSSLGLDDNTGLGVNVTDNGDVVKVQQLKKTNAPDIKILVPKSVIVSFSYESQYGGEAKFRNMTITGVDRLYPTEHRVIGDRIVAATWGIAAAMTRGDISVTGVDPQHLQLVLHKLHDAGATVTQTDDGFRVVQYERPKAVNVATLPFPGFPTDLQPMAIGLASIADGTSMITENVFEARFRFVEEMIRLGADARTDGHHAVVRGIPQLSSAPVWSSDIRAGAGLVLAGLVADGDTEVHDVFHIDRGYPLFVENLVSLGAEIERVV
jgi:5-enolpyruvylshikimate-3-phosphate synthase